MPINVRLRDVNVLTARSEAVKDVTKMQNPVAPAAPCVILLSTV